MSSVDLNTSVPHSARIYDYILGGKDNFEADRIAAAAIMEATPDIPVSMRANRQFMARVAHYLAAERGIRQFLDIGTGLPTSPNLHEVVQAVAPESHVVYVDNDPLVLVHARALLTSTPQGATAYVDADLHDVPAILESDAVKELFDLTKPVAVSLIAILQFVVEDAEVQRVVDELMAPLCPGSALAITAVTAHSEDAIRGTQAYTARGIPMKARTDEEIQAWFRGLELVEPGVTFVSDWHPAPDAEQYAPGQIMVKGGVATKR
jgi:hypothetical protein